MQQSFQHSPRVSTRRLALQLAWACALVAGCGGGGSSVPSGGSAVATSSFAAGPITGFGSVIVNGVHFDDRTAAVSDADGNPRTRDDLRLGMTTDVRGLAIGTDGDGNSASVATSIVSCRGVVPASQTDRE